MVTLNESADRRCPRCPATLPAGSKACNDCGEPLGAGPDIRMKCSVRAWCFGMREALKGVPENPEAKGLSASHGWLGNEAKPRLIGVSYKPTAQSDGMALNVCPWCGAGLRFDLKVPA